MDGRSGVVKAGTRTTAREVQGAAIMDDRTNLTSQGRKPVLVQPKPISETASREHVVPRSWKIAKNTQKQTSALRSDDARRATLILEDQVGRLIGLSGFPFETDLHKDPVTAGPRSYIRNKAHCWRRAVVHRRGRQQVHSTGVSRASSSLRRSNAICSPALSDKAFWLRCNISSSCVMSSAASTAMRS